MASISPSPAGSDFTHAARRRWVLVALLSVATFINYMDRASIGVAMPVMRGELNLDPFRQGLVFSAFFWTYALLQIPVGWLVDRFRLKPLFAIAFTIWSLAAAATGLVHTFLSLLVLRILLGIGESVYLPGGIRAITLHFPPEERALPSGIFDLGAKIGLAAATFIDAWILLHWGWRDLFFRTGGVGLLWLLPWLWLYTEGEQDKVPAASARAQFSARRAWELLKNRTVAGISIGFFAWDFFWYFLIFWIPSYLFHVRHVNLSQLKFVAALPFLIMGVTEFAGGWLANTWIRRGGDPSRVTKAIIAAGFLLALLVLPAAAVSSTPWAIFWLCAASTSGLLCSNILTVPAYCAPQSEVALWTGIQNFWGNIGGVIAPALTGYLIGRTGSYNAAFACCALVLLVGIAAYLWVLPRIRYDGQTH